MTHQLPLSTRQRMYLMQIYDDKSACTKLRNKQGIISQPLSIAHKPCLETVQECFGSKVREEETESVVASGSVAPQPQMSGTRDHDRESPDPAPGMQKHD
ncbi:hypothetical protein Mapa_016226 [Marchantia paleacea]|nr:hypothetical protein Mapa_016226 [Marchantia paleacea]